MTMDSTRLTVAVRPGASRRLFTLPLAAAVLGWLIAPRPGLAEERCAAERQAMINAYGQTAEVCKAFGKAQAEYLEVFLECNARKQECERIVDPREASRCLSDYNSSRCSPENQNTMMDNLGRLGGGECGAARRKEREATDKYTACLDPAKAPLPPLKVPPQKAPPVVDQELEPGATPRKK